MPDNEHDPARSAGVQIKAEDGSGVPDEAMPSFISPTWGFTWACAEHRHEACGGTRLWRTFITGERRVAGPCTCRCHQPGGTMHADDRLTLADLNALLPNAHIEPRPDDGELVIYTGLRIDPEAEDGPLVPTP